MERTDDEQLQQLKDWWRRNGGSIMLGLTAAVLIVAGWWGYGTWQERGAQQAAAAYAEFLQATRSGEPEMAEQAGQRVLDDHARSGYAGLTALRMARIQAEAGAYRRAAETLGWLIDNADHSAMAELARLRQARVLGEVDAEEALAALEGSVSAGFAAAYAELRGDLLRELGRYDEATEAYQQALDQEGLGAQSRELVRLKLQAVESEA
ncbi:MULTISPECIES: YfgM family protein [unclassified Halorhodospira]|uniref:YfgM family protein n=1 Tax=unclassified Halorhodospira TaxID=2626748 RepID=UPI001EE78E93|nr:MULTISPECIES: tetratricopeptide repeat protein [unclassified Halorhodospira]MCG5540972.1 tetratricopeptide repeat protein [Halorhodospira sp. M39old]MCG5545332.1 tetratricopeptide repeat protein [Halorhodospira sp. M38]